MAAGLARGARGAAGARGAPGSSGGQRGQRGRGGAVSTAGTKRAPLPRLAAAPAAPMWDDDRFDGRLDELKELGDEVVELQLAKSRLDEKIKEKTILARALMEDINSDQSWSVRDPAWTCSFVKPKPRKTLVRELLIQQGVTIKQLEKATKETPVTPYAMFTGAREKTNERQSREDEE